MKRILGLFCILTCGVSAGLDPGVSAVRCSKLLDVRKAVLQANAVVVIVNGKIGQGR